MTRNADVHNINKVIFEGFYSRVLQVVARSLSQTKMFAFDIEFLQRETPSYKERADALSEVHEEMTKISSALGFEYQVKVIEEYVSLMHDMADAIEEGNDDKLKQSIEALDKKPFLLP